MKWNLKIKHPVKKTKQNVAKEQTVYVEFITAIENIIKTGSRMCNG